MPVLVEQRDREEWLDPDNATVDLERLAQPRSWSGVTVRAVSRRLGNVRNDDEALLTADGGPVTLSKRRTLWLPASATKSDEPDSASAAGASSKASCAAMSSPKLPRTPDSPAIVVTSSVLKSMRRTTWLS